MRAQHVMRPAYFRRRKTIFLELQKKIDMATFTARIQLYGAGEKEYRTLQTEMKKELFTITKKQALKTESMLPRTEEYNRIGNLSLHEVNASIFRAVQKIGKKFSFTTIRNREK